MKRLPDGVGRTLFIAVIAGGIFAVFLMLTPKMTTSVGDVATAAVAGGDQATTTTDEVPPSTPTTLTVPTSTTLATTTTTVVATTTTEPEPGEIWEPMTPEFGYDGTVRLTLHFEGAHGEALPIMTDFDTVVWRLHVTNTTDQELWGVFAWVERAGRAYCDDHHLYGFGETDCWVSSTVYADDWVVDAWVNAWTTQRQVKDRVSLPLTVIGP